MYKKNKIFFSDFNYSFDEIIIEITNQKIIYILIFLKNNLDIFYTNSYLPIIFNILQLFGNKQIILYSDKIRFYYTKEEIENFLIFLIEGLKNEFFHIEFLNKIYIQIDKLSEAFNINEKVKNAFVDYREKNPFY